MSDPTPWDEVKRMRAEGQPRDQIELRLAAMGVAPEDSKLLLAEDLPKQEVGLGVSPAQAAAMLVGGPLIGALAVAAMTDRVAPPAELGPQTPLAATDTMSARCGQHPELASVTTCPRCGAFACRACAPKQDTFCAGCETKPAVNEERVRRQAKWTAAATFSFPVLLIFDSLLTEDSKLTQGQVIVGVAAGALPFLLLGLVQLFVRARWPGFVAAAFGAALLALFTAIGAAGLLLIGWVGGLVALAAALMAMGTARQRWLASRAKAVER